MTTKSLMKFTELLSRSEGISLIPIVVVMVIMSVIGGVFATIMGGWKINSARALDSKMAFYLADTAEMFALQDASYRFYGGNFDYGTNDSPHVVLDNSTEKADYWFEMPDLDDDDDDDSSADDASSDDSSSASSDSESDDTVDDDADDISNPTRYTIIATGRSKRGGITVAKRQIKIKADIIRSPATTLTPGVHTSGGIDGTGGGFNMDNFTTSATVSYGTGIDNVTSGSELGIVYRPAQPLDENVFKALAQDQGHYYSGNLEPANNHPNGSYYYSGSVPNFTFVEGNLTLNGNQTIYGVYWVKGALTTLNGDYQINGIIISEGDITMNGGTRNPDINGGIIHYGATTAANGIPDVSINEGFFDALNATIPIVNVVSWQEALLKPF